MTEVSACTSILERYQNLVHLGSGWLHSVLGIASSYTLKHQIGAPLITIWLNFLYKAQVCKNPFFFFLLSRELPSQDALAWFTTFAGVSCCPWLAKPPVLYSSVTVHSKAEKSSSHCYTTARTQVPSLDRSFSCSYPPILLSFSMLHLSALGITQANSCLQDLGYFSQNPFHFL